MPPLATINELSDWLGEPITEGPDKARAESMLAMASALVRSETRRDWLDDMGGLVANLPDDIGLVTLSCAARGYTNPRGLTDVSEGIDDYNRREQARVEEAGLYLTASERDLLARYAGRKHRGLGVVHTTRDDVPDLDECTWVVNGPSPVPGESY